MITIVDYGMGNLRSVEKAFQHLGAGARITSDPNVVASAEKLVLPGVGAFKDAMANLRQAGLVEPIQTFLRSSRPFLGICLGLQLLFSRSFEDGEHEGLGRFPGRVVRFATAGELKVPHMGWNRLRLLRRPPLLPNGAAEPYVYFVHSYYVEPDDPAIIAAETDYGVTFPSMIWQENVFATQFHPEKSQRIGLGMLQRFTER